jgi:hypothetical protein
MVPALGATIGMWGELLAELLAAVNAASGKTATLTLSPSFTMEGYCRPNGCQAIDLSSLASEIIIEGNRATFDV